MTLSIERHYAECHCAECRYAECPGAITTRYNKYYTEHCYLDIMLGAVVLSVVMMSVVMLNVVAPKSLPERATPESYLAVAHVLTDAERNLRRTVDLGSPY